MAGSVGRPLPFPGKRSSAQVEPSAKNVLSSVFSEEHLMKNFALSPTSTFSYSSLTMEKLDLQVYHSLQVVSLIYVKYMV